MKIWLDDVRPAPKDWIWVKTTHGLKAHLILHLSKIADIEEVSFDNDLGEGQPEGYTMLDFIEYMVVTMNYIPPVLHVHSANTPAHMRMLRTIEQIQMRLDERDVGKNIIGEQ